MPDIGKTGDAKIYKVGVVSFFNARPLIWGLADEQRVELCPAVPSALAAGLDSGEYGAALVPSIDYQRSSKPWRILPEGIIGSRGEVLTVRVFSRTPLKEVEEVACDVDSHTSVALLEVVWRLRYKKDIKVIPCSASPAGYDTVMLIGDKVLCHLGWWDYEIDLGQLWTELTGLPFAYAFWAVPDGVDNDELVGILADAYRQGLKKRDLIADTYGGEHGFTSERGQEYFRRNICYDFDDEMRQGLARFYELAHEMGIIPHNREMRFWGESI